MIKVTINHFKKFRYPYGLTIMGLLAIHSFIMFALSDEILWFILFMFESGFTVILGIEYEKENNKKNMT